MRMNRRYCILGWMMDWGLVWVMDDDDIVCMLFEDGVWGFFFFVVVIFVFRGIFCIVVCLLYMIV